MNFIEFNDVDSLQGFLIEWLWEDSSKYNVLTRIPFQRTFDYESADIHLKVFELEKK